MVFQSLARRRRRRGRRWSWQSTGRDARCRGSTFLILPAKQHVSNQNGRLRPPHLRLLVGGPPLGRHAAAARPRPAQVRHSGTSPPARAPVSVSSMLPSHCILTSPAGPPEGKVPPSLPTGGHAVLLHLSNPSSPRSGRGRVSREQRAHAPPGSRCRCSQHCR